VHVLIVYAHPEPKSFNGAMRDLAVSVLGELGHTVEVSDLYAMNFRAGAGRGDFLEAADGDYFNYLKEEMHAAEGGGFSEDIRGEQEKLMAADFLILQFPLWWFSTPAILKGWVERVMAVGFAYDRQRRFDNGVFRGRRAMLSLSAGGPAAAYSAGGISGNLEVVLWPLQNGVLNFVGYQVLPPFIAFGLARGDAEARQAILSDYEARLRGLDDVQPLAFHHLDDFDDTFRLKPDVMAKTAGQGWGR
jgi:NAD(P)H dehydrogenase (quinone)